MSAATRGREMLIGPEQEQVLLSAATAAPSLHNSQPWQFGVGPRRVELYADASRQLPNADTAGRSLLISCGAALFNLRVAAEHLGLRPWVRLLPDADDPTLVATVDVENRHGRAGPLKAYATAIPARRTNRRPFRDQTIPGSVLTNLAEAAWAENAMLRIYEDPNEVARIIDLLHEADLVERTDPTLRRERGSWVGRAGGGEGIPEPSLGPRPREPRTAFRELGDTVRGPRDHAEFEKTPTLAILSTTHDERIDWVRAGQALQRLLLTATKAGLSASFMNQPLEQDALRWLVRSPLTGIGHSQMILRIGYGEPVPATPRRPISAVRRELRDAPR